MFLDLILEKAAKIALRITMKNNLYLHVEVMISRIGANFCQVKKRKVLMFDNPETMAGPQKWRGARLLFNNKPTIQKLPRIFERSDPTPLEKIESEPTLCTTKYNIASFLLDQFFEIMVIKLIRLISIINQTVVQVSVEREPRVPKTIPVHIKPLQATIISLVDQTN